jgi:FkbM family methyltransferase
MNMKNALLDIYRKLPIPGKMAFSIWRHKRKMEFFRAKLRELERGEGPLTFAKIGAHDGVSEDPCTDILLANPRWKGVLVEPLPTFAEKLRATYQDPERFRIERVAIGDKEGTATFYYVDAEARKHLPDLPYWFDQLASLSRDHIVNHLNGVLEPFIRETTVSVRTLESLLSALNVPNLDFLHVDTEGHDLRVLSSLDLASHRPRLIFVEHKNLSDEDSRLMRDLLTDNKYMLKDCGGDYCAWSWKC